MKLFFNEYTKKYLRLCVSLFFISVVYNIFVVPINLVAGGAGGLGVLFNNIFGTDPALVVLIVSVLMFILALFVLDFEEIISTLLATILCPLFIELTSGISSVVVFEEGHMLVIVLFGAILSGIGQGLVYKDGFNLGGLSILSKAIYKYFKVSVTLCNSIVNGIIILLGAYFIGISMVLYAIIYIVVLRYVSEGIVLGASNNKTFKIISTKYNKIEKYIHMLGHDVTIYETVGSYKGEKRKLIMTVIPSSEFIIVKDYVHSVDKNAFIFVTNTYEVGMQDDSIRKGAK